MSVLMRVLSAMLCILLFLVLARPASAAVSAPAAASAPAGLGLGPVTPFALPNGLQVLVAPSHAADLVCVDVWVGAGTRRETDDNSGAAHFMEHLLFKGTATRKPGEIDAAIEDLGGSLNAATSYDWAHFYTTVASEDAPAALSVLSDAVMHAALRQSDMDTERTVILDERARELSTPETRVDQALHALMFPDSAYGRPLLGPVAHIATMTRPVVEDFYKTYYVPSNVTLVLSGNLTPAEGRAMAQRAFGDWTGKPPPPEKPAAPPSPLSVTSRALSGGTVNAVVGLAFRAPAVTDTPDAWVMDVLLTYLGQGGNNKLQTDLQNKRKIVMAVNANYLTQRDPGLLTIIADCDPQQMEAVRDAILDEVQAVRDAPLSAGDLEAARHALLASYLFDAQTVSGRADALGFYAVTNSYRYDTDYISHVLSVTPAQVQEAARRYLDTSGYALVTLLPRLDPVMASDKR